MSSQNNYSRSTKLEKCCTHAVERWNDLTYSSIVIESLEMASSSPCAMAGMA